MKCTARIQFPIMILQITVEPEQWRYLYNQDSERDYLGRFFECFVDTVEDQDERLGVDRLARGHRREARELR